MLARALRQLRDDANLSNGELARMAYAHTSTISRALSGMSLPKLDLVERIAMACGSDVDMWRDLWRAEAKERSRSGKVLEEPDAGGKPKPGSDTARGLDQTEREADAAQQDMARLNQVSPPYKMHLSRRRIIWRRLFDNRFVIVNVVLIGSAASIGAMAIAIGAGLFDSPTVPTVIIAAMTLLFTLAFALKGS
jgi:transcriptional regulator with XRE-family HTH domain